MLLVVLLFVLPLLIVWALACFVIVARGVALVVVVVVVADVGVGVAGVGCGCGRGVVVALMVLPVLMRMLLL